MNSVSNREERYDFIVVGAGAAGSVLAAEFYGAGDKCDDAHDCGPSRPTDSWPRMMEGNGSRKEASKSRKE